jgi:hypothetical protein
VQMVNATKICAGESGRFIICIFAYQLILSHEVLYNLHSLTKYSCGAQFEEDVTVTDEK